MSRRQRIRSQENDAAERRHREDVEGIHKSNAIAMQNRNLQIIAIGVALLAIVVPALLAWHPWSSESSHDSPSAQNLIMHVATSASAYHIFLPVYNAQPSDQQLNLISLTITYPTGIACAESPYYIYRLHNTIIVDEKTDLAQSNVTAESGIEKGLRVVSTGKWSGGCGPDQLTVNFTPPALILQKLTTTTVAVEIPRRLNIISEVYPSNRVLHKQVIVPNVNDLHYDYVAFRVTATTNNGVRLDSCLVLRGGQLPREQSPMQCSSLLKYISTNS